MISLRLAIKQLGHFTAGLLFVMLMPFIVVLFSLAIYLVFIVAVVCYLHDSVRSMSRNTRPHES